MGEDVGIHRTALVTIQEDEKPDDVNEEPVIPSISISENAEKTGVKLDKDVEEVDTTVPVVENPEEDQEGDDVIPIASIPDDATVIDLYFVVKTWLSFPEDGLDLKEAVKEYLGASKKRKSNVIETYGPIEEWDVSLVENMSDLFFCRREFNEDICRWDTSN